MDPHQTHMVYNCIIVAIILWRVGYWDWKERVICCAGCQTHVHFFIFNVSVTMQHALWYHSDAYNFSSRAHFVQVTKPPNELPPLFLDNSSVVDLRDGDVLRLNAVINENIATLVFFYARWCTHCKLVAKTFEKVAKKLQDKVTYCIMHGAPTPHGSLPMSRDMRFLCFPWSCSASANELLHKRACCRVPWGAKADFRPRDLDVLLCMSNGLRWCSYH